MTPASFRAVLNALVPPNPDRGIPGAGDADAADYITAQIEVGTLLKALFDQGLACFSMRLNSPFEMLPEGDRVAILKGIEADEPAFFRELIRLTYMGYYSQPRIRELLGLSAAPVHPRGYDVQPENPALMARLTAPVVARGRVYRDVQ